MNCLCHSNPDGEACWILTSVTHEELQQARMQPTIKFLPIKVQASLRHSGPFKVYAALILTVGYKGGIQRTTFPSFRA